MQNKKYPLAIILKKTNNGYLFEQLKELPLPPSKKNKKNKPTPKKSGNKGLSNRLIKQIGLDTQKIIPQSLREAPHPETQLNPVSEPNLEEQVAQNFNFNNAFAEEEDVSCEIDRQESEQIYQMPKCPISWFNKEKIHEKQAQQMGFPPRSEGNQDSKSEFNNEDTSRINSIRIEPQLYMEYRNFIVQAYQKNPKRYLTKISCRRMLRGDVNMIHKIHSLLERQGVINFGIGKDGNFCFKSQPLTKHFQQRVKPQSFLKALPEKDEEKTQSEVDTSNMTLTVINKNFSRTFRAHCSVCKLVCGIFWYANVSPEQNSQKNLCFECFRHLEDSERENYEKVDIVRRMESNTTKQSRQSMKTSWNIEDNVKLLDFMSKTQSKSWADLIETFGGRKTVEDIILQFMQFPISNFEPTQVDENTKRQIEDEAKNQEMGFNLQDYEKILSNFYENSQYAKKIKKEETLMNGNHIGEHIQNQQSEKKGFENLKAIVDLMSEELLQKLNCLEERENTVEEISGKIEVFCGKLSECQESAVESEHLVNGESKNDGTSEPIENSV